MWPSIPTTPPMALTTPTTRVPTAAAQLVPTAVASSIFPSEVIQKDAYPSLRATTGRSAPERSSIDFPALQMLSAEVSAEEQDHIGFLATFGIVLPTSLAEPLPIDNRDRLSGTWGRSPIRDRGRSRDNDAS